MAYARKTIAALRNTFRKPLPAAAARRVCGSGWDTLARGTGMVVSRPIWGVDTTRLLVS